MHASEMLREEVFAVVGFGRRMGVTYGWRRGRGRAAGWVAAVS